VVQAGLKNAREIASVLMVQSKLFKCIVAVSWRSHGSKLKTFQKLFPCIECREKILCLLTILIVSTRNYSKNDPSRSVENFGRHPLELIIP